MSAPSIQSSHYVVHLDPSVFKKSSFPEWALCGARVGTDLYATKTTSNKSSSSSSSDSSSDNPPGPSTSESPEIQAVGDRYAWRSVQSRLRCLSTTEEKSKNTQDQRHSLCPPPSLSRLLNHFLPKCPPTSHTDDLVRPRKTSLWALRTFADRVHWQRPATIQIPQQHSNATAITKAIARVLVVLTGVAGIITKLGRTTDLAAAPGRKYTRCRHQSSRIRPRGQRSTFRSLCLWLLLA